jgi:hypothetical protein
MIVEQKVLKVLKNIPKINIPNYTLICPKCKLWIGFTPQEVEEHLKKMKEAIKINAQYIEKHSNGSNGC